MLERRAGIVLESLKGKVDPPRVEQRQRPHPVRVEEPTILDLGVDHFVADQVKPRRRKPARKLGRRKCLRIDVRSMLEHIRIRNLRLRDDDIQRHIEVCRNLLKLFQKVVAEERRLRDRADIQPSLRQLGEGPRQRRDRSVRMIGQPQFGVAEIPARPCLRIGCLAPQHERLERRAQPGHGGCMQLRRLVDRLCR